ncbi:MAG: serine/threonine-protein kinase [Cyanobacteria bacterium J06649_4]
MAISSSESAVIERLGKHYQGLQPIGQPFGYKQLLAKDTKGRRSVVIKSLTIEENTPMGDVCCFEREIHLLESLSHPTIPRYIDSFSFDSTDGQDKGKGLVLVQSHQGGQTLEQQVVAGREFSEADIKSIAKQLLQGLVYLHSKGLVHRDIKPSNIAVAGNGTVVGQASWLNLGTVQYVQAQRPDALVGTYGYMPPEQVGGQAAFASDLYSLGATIVYLVTGSHLGELPRHGLNAKFACSTKRLSPNFQQWINWLIEPYVGDRPHSAKKALSALNHLPIAMLKQRIWRPQKSQLLPVPITTTGRDHYQPFFTRIKSKRRPHSLELIVPPIGLRSSAFKQSMPPLLIGGTLLISALYLMSLLSFGPAMLASVEGLATLTAAALAAVGCAYSFRFLKNGLQYLQTCLLRNIHIEIESDVLLIGYRYWLRSPKYIVNTKRECIYNISALPDGGALRILTHHNRTKAACVCYKLTTQDGALSSRDIRWLTSLLNDWRTYPAL